MNRSLLITALLVAACAPPALDSPNLDGLRAMSSEVDPTRMMDIVGKLVDDHLADTPLPCSSGVSSGPQCYLSRDRARERLRSELVGLGYVVTEQVTDEGDASTRNLVAEKRGLTRPDEVVLVGAHFDAFWGGADDNSSGVAAVLEIARAVSARSFDRTIRSAPRRARAHIDNSEVPKAGDWKTVESYPVQLKPRGNELTVRAVNYGVKAGLPNPAGLIYRVAAVPMAR